MKSLKLSLLFAFLIWSNTYAQRWEVGKTYTDEENWTAFIVGDLPLIISVPHGGTTISNGVPLRDCKDAVTVTDSKTIELVKEIEKALKIKNEYYESK